MECSNCGYTQHQLDKKEQEIVEAVNLMLKGKIKQGQDKIININN
jgi:Zn ribbon nucleic-acid-binding protein|tara:strand:+ start:58 stop:192 length:135 start_codon:yes stop_codon:yes gene_type:complete